MEQTKKLSIDTILKQQEALMRKLNAELSDLEKAIADKREQIALQEKVLEMIKSGS